MNITPVTEYMARERLPLTRCVIDEARIEVATEHTGYVSFRLQPQVDLDRLKMKLKELRRLAKEKGVKIIRIQRTSEQLESLEEVYADTYRRYEKDFHTLAFLWQAKVDSGLYMGTSDDLMIREVLTPMKGKLESYFHVGTPLYIAASLENKILSHLDWLNGDTLGLQEIGL